MERLPPELVLQIAHYSTSASIQKRRDFQFIAPSLVLEPARVFELQRRARALSSGTELRTLEEAAATNGDRAKRAAITNWDPTYKTEKIDWYEEHVARHAPISMSWLEQPRLPLSRNAQDIKGLGLYRTVRQSLIVAPLDDGSLSIWDIGKEDGPNDGRAGTVIARSESKTLSSSSQSNYRASNGFHSAPSIAGIVEGVSVDSARNKAYIAKDNALYEMDLETLQFSSTEFFPFAITAVSEATHPTPLTISTTHSLHLHDPRAPMHTASLNQYHAAQVDTSTASLPPSPRGSGDFYRLLSPGSPNRHAPLLQPGPLSITHLTTPHGQYDSYSGSICVAGRFPSILTYNRRMFPRLASTIHSGARLASMTSIPHPILYPRSDLTSDSDGSHTLIACGEYNGKGSLEIYPYSTSTGFGGSSNAPSPSKNRTSASRTKLLSVIPHGTRIVFSDSDGGLKWVERDGHSLVRRWNINAYTASVTQTGIFDGHSATSSALSSDDTSTNDGGNVATKLLPIGGPEDSRGEIAVWTGEKIGILGFRPRPRWEWEWKEEKVEGEEEMLYSERMRRALKGQADE
ncbi:MAG: hypothetical protein Q9174_004985, partial [Haloplaca sp. 1 TL-2023]